jgi:hypothetical protein
MKKLTLFLKEGVHLVLRHKLFFLLPLIVLLALLTFLAFEIGPSLAISFVYAGL